MPVLPELKIRQKIMVTRKGEKQWFFSTIQDIRDGELYIEIPHQGESALVLYRGEEVDVRFSAEGASYVFSSRVIGKTLDSIPLFRLTPPENVQRIQQRNFVRLPVALEVFYALPPEKNRRPRYKKAISNDLSGGGMRLTVNELLAEGTLLNLKFSLPLKKGVKEISAAGKVVRRWAFETEGVVTYQVAVEFQGIGRTQQDYIVNFIFSRMAEQGRLKRS
ncbi:MAG: flagellar brake domain-containing protein [Bacillota bacterium]